MVSGGSFPGRLAGTNPQPISRAIAAPRMKQRAPEEKAREFLGQLCERLEVFEPRTAALGTACPQGWRDELLDQARFAVRGCPEAAQVARGDAEACQLPAGEGDLRVGLSVPLLAALGVRHQEPELLELPGEARIDPCALAELGEIELVLFPGESHCAAPLAIAPNRRGELLTDHAQR